MPLMGPFRAPPPLAESHDPTRARDLLEGDHTRLDKLLTAALGDPNSTIDMSAYGEFRAGLLRHIGMEEKILFPTARRLRAGEPLEQARQAKLDHAALAALLVPTPPFAIISRLQALLALHNPIEEGPLASTSCARPSPSPSFLRSWLGYRPRPLFRRHHILTAREHSLPSIVYCAPRDAISNRLAVRAG